MDQNPITLRAAKPTIDEGLACARYLDEAAEGFFRFMLGRRASQIIAQAYTRPNHSYSFENVVFAEYHGQIAGMVLGYTSEQHRHFSDQPLKESTGYPALRVSTIRFILAPLFRALETVAGGDFYLLSFATDEIYRGKGIGTVLLDSIEKRALASGSNRLTLDVSANNEGARRLYERRGMTVESQWPRRLHLPALRFYRMTKMLRTL